MTLSIAAPPGFLSLRGVATARLGPINLDVGRGECVAILGASGAGKSLLLRQIADLDPGEGRITLEGAPREAMAASGWRRQVIYCQAEPGWWDDRVAPHFADLAGATALLPRLGLPAQAMEAAVHQLSTGERQRLGLARALAARPRVLLLDEPTASLDAASVALVEREIARRMDDGLTVVMVTHDEGQARRLARRLFRLAQGGLTAWAWA